MTPAAVRRGGFAGRALTPAAVRWGGFAGSVATAASAYLGGSGFVRVPSVNPITLLSGQRGVLLPICWVLGTALLIAAWWWGRNVLPSTRWALLTAGLWLVPVLPFLPLGSADVYSYACQGFVQHAGGDPYATGVQEFGCPWLGSVATSWRDSPAPYGPLFLLLAAQVVGLAGGSLGAVIAGLRVVALAGLALAAIGLPVLARRAGADPAKAVWLVLACPLVLVHLVSGAHNDALMIGLIVAGLALVAAGRTPGWLVAGGVVLGLAVAVKATAVVVLPFAVLIAVAPLPGPAPRASLPALWRPAAAVGGGAALATVVLSVLSGRGFGWVAGLLRSGDSVTWGSPSTAVGLTVEFLTGADAVPVTRVLGVVLLAVILVVLWWRARAGGALPGAGLALAATVLCAPVFHPWYATWPLAVLAATGTGSRPATEPGSRPAAEPGPRRVAEPGSWPAAEPGPRRAAEPGSWPDAETGSRPAGESRWLLGLCAFAATLTLPAGYNWALYTRTPGALVVTAVLLVLACRRVLGLRRRRVSA